MNGKESRDDISEQEPRGEALERLRSSNTVNMSPELFEKLYLQPQNRVRGDLRKTFANPTPLGLIGYVVALTPLSCCLLGWRGAGRLGAANIGVFYFVGGLLQMFCGILEFFLGNTFPFVAFTSYGSIFLALAATLHPFYGTAAAYSPTGSFEEGLTEPGFNASIAFFLIAVAILNFYFMICALKINFVFLSIFTSAGLGFTLLSAAFWVLADGSIDTGSKLMVATGASWFATSIMGWYLLLTQILAVMEYPIALPVGDLSRFWTRTSVSIKESQMA